MRIVKVVFVSVLLLDDLASCAYNGVIKRATVMSKYSKVGLSHDKRTTESCI